MEAPIDGDGGLVVATSESMTCLSCPHSDACGHKHAAGRALARPTHAAHHNLSDMHRYQHLVHSALSNDGTRLRLRGKSSLAIEWPAITAAFATTTLHQTIRKRQLADPDDDDIDLIVAEPGAGAHSTRNPPPSPTPRSPCSLDGSPRAGSAGGGDSSAAGGVPDRDHGNVTGSGTWRGVVDDRAGHPSPSSTTHADGSSDGISTAGSAAHGDVGAAGGVADSAVLAIGSRFRSLQFPCLVMDSMSSACPVTNCPFSRGTWCTTCEDNVHELTDNVSSSGSHRHDALVFHLGVCYAVRVRGSYDGARDGLINMGTWLFTYEFLQAFLDQLYGSAITFRQYLLSALRGYVRASAGCSSAQREHVLSCMYLDQMNSHSRQDTGSKKCYQAFVHAVLDFITLQVPRDADAVAGSLVACGHPRCRILQHCYVHVITHKHRCLSVKSSKHRC